MAQLHPNTPRSGYMQSARSCPLRASSALLQLRPTRAAKQLGRCLASVSDTTNGRSSANVSSRATRATRGDQVVFFTSTELADPDKIEAAYQFIGIPKGYVSLGLPDLEAPIQDLLISRSSALKSKPAEPTRTAQVAAAKQRAADIIAEAEQRAANILATAVAEANAIKIDAASAVAALTAAREELAGLKLSIAERKQYLQMLEQKAYEMEAVSKVAEKIVKPGASSSETHKKLAITQDTRKLALKLLQGAELEMYCEKHKVDYRYKELPVEPLRELVARFAGLSHSTSPLFIDDMTWDQVGWHNTTVAGLQKYCSRHYIAYSRRSKAELLGSVIKYKKSGLVITGGAKPQRHLRG